MDLLGGGGQLLLAGLALDGRRHDAGTGHELGSGKGALGGRVDNLLLQLRLLAFRRDGLRPAESGSHHRNRLPASRSGESSGGSGREGGEATCQTFQAPRRPISA